MEQSPTAALQDDRRESGSINHYQWFGAGTLVACSSSALLPLTDGNEVVVREQQPGEGPCPIHHTFPYSAKSARGSTACAMRLPRTLLGAAKSAARAVFITTARRLSISGVESETNRRARHGNKTRW